MLPRVVESRPQHQLRTLNDALGSDVHASSPAHCRLVTQVLRARDGVKTRVELSADRTLDVLNVAEGQDVGDDYEHITTNISPDIAGCTVDLFFTDEVARIVDPWSGDVLWKADGVPNIR